MADWHVLEKNGNTYRIAYHIAIPAANNGAGVSYRTAIVNSGLGGASILKDGDGTNGTISAAEKALIASGAVVERVVDVPAAPSLTNPQLLALVAADFAANSADLRIELQARLIQYGRTG